MLQLHKLLIQKLFISYIICAPISSNVEGKRIITSLGLEPMTFTPNPHALLSELSGEVKKNWVIKHKYNFFVDFAVAEIGVKYKLRYD